MGNNKNKKVSKKDQQSNKSSSSRTSSVQKENRPKKTKIKPDPGDRIAMSQELLKHTKRKSSLNRSRTKPDSKRVLPNGRVMPSLADLEKMYDDSDDDTNSKDLIKIDTQSSSPVDCNPVIDITTILSPDTCSKVSQQCKEILNKWSKTPQNATAVRIESPPRKRLKFDISDEDKTYDIDDEFDDLPVVITTPKKYDTSDTYKITDTLQNNLRKSPITELSKNVEKLTKETEDGNLSETSVDSNKTIEYKITPTTPQSSIISQAFCPLPSTSKDDKTFSKNDELFFECTKEINNNKTKDISTSSPITDIPTESSEIKKEIIIEDCKKEIKMEVDNVIEVVDTEQISLSDATNPGDKKYDDDDDDCIFVDSYTSPTKAVSKEMDIIDLDHDFSDTNTCNYDDIVDEVIDVDALIAKNQLILNKYKTADSNKLDCNSLVVDVDVTKIAESSTRANNTQKQENNQNTSNVVSKISNNTPNLQGPPNNEDEVINITDLDAEKRRHNQVSQTKAVSYPDIIDVEIPRNRNRHRFTEEEVSNFFKGDYRTGQFGPSPSLNSCVFNLIRNLDFQSVPLATEFNVIEDIPHVPRPSQRGSSAFPVYPVSQLFPISPETDETDVITLPPLTESTTIQRLPPAPIFQRNQSAQSTQKKQRKPKTKRNKDNPPLTLAQPPPSTSPEKSSRKLGECPICMERLSDRVIASTICGHVFCMSCLEQAIKTNKRCPTCRKIIKKNGYHQIFL